MNRIYRKSPFWSVCGPFLIFMGIEMAVQTIVEMIVMIPYMAKLLAEEMRAGGQAVPCGGNSSSLKPSADGNGRTSGRNSGTVCIVYTSDDDFLFRKDRKLEQTYQIPVNKKAKWNAYPQLIVLGAAFSIGFTCLSAMAEIAFYSESYQESQAIAYAAGFPAQIVCLGDFSTVGGRNDV